MNPDTDYEKAIRVLESYKDQIDNLQYDTAHAWYLKVHDTLKNYLAKNSSILKAFANFYFTVVTDEVNDKPSRNIFGHIQYSHFNEKGEKEKAKQLLDACIEYLTHTSTVPIIKETKWEKEILSIGTLQIVETISNSLPSEPTKDEIIGEILFQLLHLEARLKTWEKLINEEIGKENPALVDDLKEMFEKQCSAIYQHLSDGQNDISEYLNHALQKYLRNRIL